MSSGLMWSMISLTQLAATSFVIKRFLRLINVSTPQLCLIDCKSLWALLIFHFSSPKRQPICVAALQDVLQEAVQVQFCILLHVIVLYLTILQLWRAGYILQDINRYRNGCAGCISQDAHFTTNKRLDRELYWYYISLIRTNIFFPQLSNPFFFLGLLRDLVLL